MAPHPIYPKICYYLGLGHKQRLKKFKKLNTGIKSNHNIKKDSVIASLSNKLIMSLERLDAIENLTDKDNLIAITCFCYFALFPPGLK
jgi:hypothetical protein